MVGNLMNAGVQRMSNKFRKGNYFLTTNKAKEMNLHCWLFNERRRSTNGTNLARQYFLTTNKTKETNFSFFEIQ
jgi:hypothetical protein